MTDSHTSFGIKIKMVPKREGIFTNSSHHITEQTDSAKAFAEIDEDERSRQQPSPQIRVDKNEPAVNDSIVEKKDTVFLTQNIEEDFGDEQVDDEK